MLKFCCSLLFIILCQVSFGQKMNFSSNKKPLIDTTVHSKGLLGGRLGTGLEGTGEKIKKSKEDFNKLKSESQDVLNELGIHQLGKSISKSIKKKFTPKDEYEGIKTEKRIAQYGTGNRATVEEVNVIKYVEDEKISPYLQEIWWFDPSQNRVVNTPLKDAKNPLICHGPYKKFVNQTLVEEGFFYQGGKDARWEKYGPENELEDKAIYKKGFPAEAIISYYDVEKKKIKEVIPRVYGKIRGQYLSFYQSGLLAMEGKLDDSVRVGRWREYHEKGAAGRLKKEWKYGKDKFDDAEPVLIQERDTQAKVIFQNPNSMIKKSGLPQKNPFNEITFESIEEEEDENENIIRKSKVQYAEESELEHISLFFKFFPPINALPFLLKPLSTKSILTPPYSPPDFCINS